jgi:hypothetical protein
VLTTLDDWDLRKVLLLWRFAVHYELICSASPKSDAEWISPRSDYSDNCDAAGKGSNASWSRYRDVSNGLYCTCTKESSVDSGR